MHVFRLIALCAIVVAIGSGCCLRHETTVVHVHEFAGEPAVAAAEAELAVAAEEAVPQTTTTERSSWRMGWSAF